MGAGGPADGAAGASAAGAGRGRAPGRHERRTPGSAPRRRGGAGRHRGRPADPRSFSVRPTERGREAERGSPLPPHRSGEPGTRRPETSAAAGCASMADAARPWRGQRASTGTRGGHPALVVARPRVPRPPRTADNVSPRRLRRLPAPGPLPLRQLITQRPHRSPPLRRGGCWEMKCRARWSLEEAAPKGTTTPRMHLPLSCFASPSLSPLFLWFFSSQNLCLLTAVLGTRALGCPSCTVPKRQSDFKRTVVLFKAVTDEARRGKKGEAAA